MTHVDAALSVQLFGIMCIIYLICSIERGELKIEKIEHLSGKE